MNAHPYLNFPGTCKEAMEFYADTFGGQIVSMFPHAGTPAAEHVPADWQEKIMHATLVVGDAVFMASDAPPGMYQKPQGLYVSLNIKEPADADRIYEKLVEGGEAQMPITETFWAERFAMLTDRFGTPWMINCEGNVASKN